MELLINYLGTGKLEATKDYSYRNSVVSLIIYKILDINLKIIPFFFKNPLLGVKKLDFLD
jgi:LAGLIDADG endonuclease